ncbi:MAG TPA: hypothetical protein VFC44_27190 [Candidatus Saccharimonadales bacterium]|nr:hypothetical protein [Candidatus Saccharimonadales bacterium]
MSPAATEGGFEVVCVFTQVAKFVQGLLMLETILAGEGFGEVRHGAEFGFMGGISDPTESLLQGGVGGSEGVSAKKFNRGVECDEAQCISGVLGMEDLLLARNDNAHAVLGTLVAADVGDAAGPAAMASAALMALVPPVRSAMTSAPE